MTVYQSQYLAHLLSLRGSPGTIESLSRSIANARVDLNPHQVDAALFALRSPLSQGVLLADEVGLGKTIEAGLVISQRWAERRRRILLIVPATLRKQWQQELAEKFYLPSVVLDSLAFHQQRKSGRDNPFDRPDSLLICSYQFAVAKAVEIRLVPWDLCVIDEAHRLRNVYKPSNKIARSIADSLRGRTKLLLTATPLQNSLMELYGLISLIDERVFGDAESFREQFTRNVDEGDRNRNLRERLKPICMRTLRRQVIEYVPFTRRVPITQDFRPNDDEQALYEAVSAFLQRETLISLPSSQRSLITLVLRKLLASSTFAIAKTLHRLVSRLQTIARDGRLLTGEDFDGIEELEDELGDAEAGDELRDEIDPALLRDELAELRRYATLADGIESNAKGEALIPALASAFEKAVELGAARKAVIFTESRRTQDYLFELLSANGYDGKIVLINSGNSDPKSRQVYAEWLTRHAGQDCISGSASVDMKAAIVEEFRERATILIATEAAAEGVNLQFCSMLINYDLPWNPQRIEQRIGRCHRYGQKHDVVVVNFLNRRNDADQRVFDILSAKFRLFDGVFGASDEVLGALESGVDIERRIAQVYQACRSPAEITAAFDALQRELDEQIQSRMTNTRQVLLENFDEDVSARLRVNRDKTLATLSDREKALLDLTRIETDGDAHFDPDAPRFHYRGADGPEGTYQFDWKRAEEAGEHFYRQDHPLAVKLVERALTRPLPMGTVRFDYDAYGAMISSLKPYRGRSGWLELSRLTIESFDAEEFLLLTAQADDGAWLDPETTEKLLRIPAKFVANSSESPPDLTIGRTTLIREKVREVDERNARFFEDEVQKLDRWSEDLKIGLEREIQELDKQIRETKKTAALAASLAEKLDLQRRIKDLEASRSQKRRNLFESQDEIGTRRDDLISQTEKNLKQRQDVVRLFTIQWELS
jgi:ERCC4-related helicase